MGGEPQGTGGPGASGPSGQAASGTGASGEGQVPVATDGTAPGAAPTRGDRLLLGLFIAYAALLLVAAWAQVSGNRALLDLFDFRRLFTR